MCEDYCDCCGQRGIIRPNRRPHVPLLTDEDILKMVDRDGEESAQNYVYAMTHFENTNECSSCRMLGSDDYFITRKMSVGGMSLVQ